MASRSSLELECESKKPITWKYIDEEIKVCNQNFDSRKRSLLITNIFNCCSNCKYKIKDGSRNIYFQGEKMSRVEVKINETGNAYRAKLILRNASFIDTGYFYCTEENATDIDRKITTSCYVYVEGKYEKQISYSYTT